MCCQEKPKPKPYADKNFGKKQPAKEQVRFNTYVILMCTTLIHAFVSRTRASYAGTGDTQRNNARRVASNVAKLLLGATKRAGMTATSTTNAENG